MLEEEYGPSSGRSPCAAAGATDRGRHADKVELQALLDVKRQNPETKPCNLLRTSWIGLSGLAGSAAYSVAPVVHETSRASILLATKSCGGAVARLKQEAFPGSATSRIVVMMPTPSGVVNVSPG